jgi:3-deoxy-D-manno-octulosonic-acid transferase
VVFYFYTTLLYLLFPLIFPFLFYLSRKERYKESIPARFWLKRNPPFSKPRRFWFHSCSLGETRALFPLLQELYTRGEIGEGVNLSVITNTGYREGKKIVEKFGGECRYLPFETLLPFWLRPHLTPKKLIVMEAELWLLFFRLVKKRGGEIILLNGRISDRSYPRYRKFRWFYRHLFRNVDLILAQTPEDKRRFLQLGAGRVEVVGNIKSLATFTPTARYTFPKPAIVAGSTHRGEEEIILEGVDYRRFTLVLAPRHPERFGEVWELVEKFAQKRGVTAGLFSRGELNRDIVVVDKLGELINLYATANRVILGGSLVEGVGGHNPIEVAFFGKPLISGPHIFNQKELYRLVEGVQWVNSPEELRKVVNSPTLPSTTLNRGEGIEKIVDLITGKGAEMER